MVIANTHYTGMIAKVLLKKTQIMSCWFWRRRTYAYCSQFQQKVCLYISSPGISRETLSSSESAAVTGYIQGAPGERIRTVNDAHQLEPAFPSWQQEYHCHKKLILLGPLLALCLYLACWTGCERPIWTVHAKTSWALLPPWEQNSRTLSNSDQTLLSLLW